MSAVPAGCIFDEDWWLDAAAPGGWQRVEVRWDQVLVGSLSFAATRRMGLRFIGLPPLTRTASPWLQPPPGAPGHALMKKVKILAALMAQLPPHERFDLALGTNCPNALPFVMLNYPVGHTYTFVAAASEASRAAMHQKTRNVVNKAARDFEVVEGADLSRFFAVLRSQFGAKSRADAADVQRLFDAAHARGQATVLCAEGAGGVDSACAVLVWDARSLYFWLSARNPECASTGALSLLIAHAASLAHGRGLDFDTDGFGTHRSGAFLSKFGFTPAVRPYVSHGTGLWKLSHLVSSALRGERDDRHYRY
ncbi:GNAT family N-acetyltransferase [Ramlibacter sp. PS4R-6]|uniref:GNAT family N-acetyltransferase n=1 Tax=Ramlibacter sp. PS4R-6 TaxID=3133438 RepID=UPI003094FD20